MTHDTAITEIITMPETPAPDPSAPEHERARWWRENIVKLSRRELAERIGVSESTITNFELGHVRETGKPIDENAMLRYRLACAAITLGVEFDWLTCALEPRTPVRISVEGPSENVEVSEIKLPPKY